MKRGFIRLGLLVLICMVSPAAAFAEAGRSSMELSLTVTAPDPEPGFLLDGVQAQVMLVGLGILLVLMSTFLKVLYSRHRG